MAPSEGRNVRNKLFSTILAVVFMIKMFTPSQVYRLPKYQNNISMNSGNTWWATGKLRMNQGSSSQATTPRQTITEVYNYFITD